MDGVGVVYCERGQTGNWIGVGNVIPTIFQNILCTEAKSRNGPYDVLSQMSQPSTPASVLK